MGLFLESGGGLTKDQGLSVGLLASPHIFNMLLYISREKKDVANSLVFSLLTGKDPGKGMENFPPLKRGMEFRK